MAKNAIRLGDLGRACGDLLVRIEGPANTTITGLSLDSRSVGPGALFFCVPGAVTDGHLFARTAVERGAAAVCVERPVDAPAPTLVVSDVRRAMARVAAAFYGWPVRDLSLLGVTGTNGKTTTVFLLESILNAAGHRTGLIGTIMTRIGSESRPGVRTTPDSLDLQRLFAEMRAAGCDSVAMEVTSHGLALGRVEGVMFDAAAFTNLSQDHLDFHHSMEDYFEAKRSLFVPERVKCGAINVDDPYGRKLFAEARVECVAFGVSPEAEVRGEEVTVGAHGSEFTISAPAGKTRVATRLAGSFNVSNCLAAAATALQAGISLDAVEAGIRRLGSVPGRFETINSGQPFAVVIDYAHTPDSLDNVLRAARSLVAGAGRVFCVFGCGGDRDRGKRPLMGATAARLADFVLVTSDNPRNEDPEAIISEILEGVLAERGSGPDAVRPNRREAIADAVKAARAGDVVVIAGKGHEQGQEARGVVRPFDDREVARAELDSLGWRATE
jgi:UDP-N-acetylmuramoyl-L-alanyl-D-glutamate--2,6-diaminopimelate ligase